MQISSVSEAADTGMNFNSLVFGDELSWRTKGPVDLKGKVTTLGRQAYTEAQHNINTSVKKPCSQQRAAERDLSPYPISRYNHWKLLCLEKILLEFHRDLTLDTVCPIEGANERSETAVLLGAPASFMTHTDEWICFYSKNKNERAGEICLSYCALAVSSQAKPSFYSVAVHPSKYSSLLDTAKHIRFLGIKM